MKVAPFLFGKYIRKVYKTKTYLKHFFSMVSKKVGGKYDKFCP